MRNKNGRCLSCMASPCLMLTGCASSDHWSSAEEDRYWDQHFRRMREDVAKKQAAGGPGQEKPRG